MSDAELIGDEMEMLVAEAIDFFEWVELARARESLASAHAIECKGEGSQMLILRAHYNAANRLHQICRRRNVDPEFRALVIDTHKRCRHAPSADRRPEPDSPKEND